MRVTKMPMSLEMRNEILSINSIDDRYDVLNNYVKRILKDPFK